MPLIDVHAHPIPPFYRQALIIGALNQVDAARRRGVESANAVALFPRFKKYV
jgi:hypothetical protein